MYIVYNVYCYNFVIDFSKIQVIFDYIHLYTLYSVPNTHFNTFSVSFLPYHLFYVFLSLLCRPKFYLFPHIFLTYLFWSQITPPSPSLPLPLVQMQMGQFCLVATHSLYAFYAGKAPFVLAAFQLFVMLNMLVLFYQFFLATYAKKPAPAKKDA